MGIDMRLGGTMPEDSAYMPIVENKGDTNLYICLPPGEGIYVKIVENPPVHSSTITIS